MSPRCPLLAHRVIRRGAPFCPLLGGKEDMRGRKLCVKGTLGHPRKFREAVNKVGDMADDVARELDNFTA